MTIRLAILVAVLLALAASAAPAAVRNGDLVYGWSELNEPELGPFTYVQAIRRVLPGGGVPRTVLGCEHTVMTAGQVPCPLEQYIDPTVSRDQARIAFDAGASIALVQPDGSGLQVLPATSEDDGEPSFSAAGKRLAFSCGRHSSGSGGDGRGICVRDLTRDTVRRVTGGTDPAWSSRNWIAFETNDDEQVWMVRPGGRGLRRLTSSGSEPTWSPHGTKLAFVRGNAILVLDLATHRARRVQRDVSATDLAWSPDGRRIAYTLFDGGVWTVRTDGTHVRELVDGGVGATYSLQAAGVDWQALR